MFVTAKSDIGKMREENQDRVCFSVLDESCLYSAVCDGMGGRSGGSIASSIASETITNEFSQEYHPENIRTRDIDTMLRSIVLSANKHVFGRSISDTELEGMGTTVVMAFIVDEKLYVAHVGDSRAYLVYNKEISRLTKDHSVVQEMIDNGLITPEAADKSPYKHIITRVLGVEPEVETEVSVYDVIPGSKILLCSDGLTNMLTDSEILDIFGMFDSDSDICDVLIDSANENGGADNISVSIISL